MKEYFAYLDGCLIDSNGYKTSHGVTAYTKIEAVKALTKAKRYYKGRVRGCDVSLTCKG